MVTETLNHIRIQECCQGPGLPRLLGNFCETSALGLEYLEQRNGELSHLNLQGKTIFYLSLNRGGQGSDQTHRSFGVMTRMNLIEGFFYKCRLWNEKKKCYLQGTACILS